MINKKLDQINIEDLNNLIENAVSEKKNIEYKRTFPGGTDTDKKEFLADISSFANASGGDLIYGIIEEGGLPTQIVGVEIDNADAEILKYENLTRDGLDPRINVSTHIVKINDRSHVFIFRVSKSWIGPHRVIFGGHDKFYSRNSAGKYALDTTELRSAFNLAQTLIDKVLRFRTSRIAELYANNTPIPTFEDGAKIVLQLIPFDAFGSAGSLDIREISQDPDNNLRPIYTSGWNSRINFDGFLTYSDFGYVQAYRNGIIEAVDRGMLVPHVEGKLQIASIAYEKNLLEALANYLKFLKKLNINPPVAVLLTLVGVKGYKMSTRSLFPDNDKNHIDKDILQLPEVIIESFDTKVEDILRPIFDLIWNCCGFEKSTNFDDDGNWVETR